MLDFAEIVVRVGLLRTESRGAHCRVDYRKKNDKRWLKSITIGFESGRKTLIAFPVETAKLDPKAR